MLKRLFFRLLGRPGAHSAGRGVPRRPTAPPEAPPVSGPLAPAPVPTAQPQAPIQPQAPAPPQAPNGGPAYPVGSKRVRLILKDGSELTLPPDPALEERAAYLTRSLLAPPPPPA
jgi:hypothetical protein